MTSSPDISSLSVGRCRKGARDECVLATAARRSALGPVSESCEDCRCMSCVVEPDGSRDPLRSDGGLIAASSGMKKRCREATCFFFGHGRSFCGLNGNGRQGPGASGAMGQSHCFRSSEHGAGTRHCSDYRRMPERRRHRNQWAYPRLDPGARANIDGIRGRFSALTQEMG